MKTKLAYFLMTFLLAIEEAELLCTVVSDTGTDVIILPQAPVLRLCPSS
jgi:hypothetical protein